MKESQLNKANLAPDNIKSRLEEMISSVKIVLKKKKTRFRNILKSFLFQKIIIKKLLVCKIAR